MDTYGKHPLFLSHIKERKLLNREGSTKKTYHIVLDLSNLPIRYKVGDALAIFPTNPPDLVDEILEHLGASGEEEILDPKRQNKLLLRHFLSHRTDLIRLPRLLTKSLPLLAKEQQLYSSLKEIDLATFLSHRRDKIAPLQEFIKHLVPLLPRFYSLASSQMTTSNEAHLLVTTFSYKKGGKIRRGIGSEFLCERAEIKKTQIPIYLQSTPHFTLPSDKLTPILMIGPGTGVAPYRGFLEQRYHESAKGKNWLIFGERHRATDYYYQSFFESLEREKFLRLTTAFSRDQPKKIYVQHVLLNHSAQVWRWIREEGAYVYICGDKQAMAKEVSAAFHAIMQKEGGMSTAEAKNYIKQLRREKRFLLDVY